MKFKEALVKKKKIKEQAEFCSKGTLYRIFKNACSCTLQKKKAKVYCFHKETAHHSFKMKAEAFINV